MRRSAIFFISLLALGATAPACKVPVFRYALERWAADAHRAVVFYRGDASSERVAALTQPFIEKSAANIRVETVDLTSLTEAQLWEFERLDEIGDEPVLRLYLPPAAERPFPYWEGPLTEENVARALDSPARRALAESILAGSAATWLWVERSTGKARNDLETGLGHFLAQAETTLSLPDGVLTPGDVSANGLTPDGEPVEWDDVLRTPIPLKIAFPMLRVPRDDPRESIFVSMLLAISETTAGDETNALAVPVFGRGRCMPGIPAARINEETVTAACRYLCGECSCQIKDQNPGVDLMLAVDWDAALTNHFTMIERPLPPMTGIGGGVAVVPAIPAATRDERPPAIGRVVGLTLGGLLVAAAAGTVLVKRRQTP